jgi:molybdenum cofactor cytidylyltransferase
MHTPILILAAGQSTRMRGTDKLAQIIDAEPQLHRITAAACSVSTRVFVALTPLRVALIQDLPATPLILPASSEGMGGTLRAAVAALPDCTHFMVLLADMPDITAQDMLGILAAAHSAPDACIWRGASVTGQPGHPILFHASLRPKFADLHGDAGGDVIVKPLKDQTILIPLPHARTDLDTPEDWALWRRSRGE